MRLFVFPRDKYTCQDCGWQPDPPPAGWDGSVTLSGPALVPSWPRNLRRLNDYRLLTLGHLIPATEGGLFVHENIFAQCSRCNYGEGNKIKAAHDRGLTLAGDPWP